jgi:hypothetical protein
MRGVSDLVVADQALALFARAGRTRGVTKPNATYLAAGAFALACLTQTGCRAEYRSEGEKLARTNCAACHAFPEPRLLDKKTWEQGVLPRMAPRLGVMSASLSDEMARDPQMVVLNKALPREDWDKIVAYFRENAPDVLPYQSVPAEPQLDPRFFRATAFSPGLKGSAIVTVLKTDPGHQRIFVGQAGSNTLSVFDWDRHLISSVVLGSPPTDVIVEGDSVLVLESGILDPNDQPKGSLVKYAFAGLDSLGAPRTVLDSLYRPVFARAFDFDADGREEFLVCEYGNNRGRLALYRDDGSRYERQILDPSPGAIRFEIRDMTGDGAPDIVALFAQADERIVLFENDGKGTFSGAPRVLARFPPVYGSMYFSMNDFNGDGRMDIVYVNGDNFDYSRILKPYHGVRILENDGNNSFTERFFFPVYGAARAEVADFDKDGDLDILATSNFADAERHPERGIMYLENLGRYAFKPYAFTVGARNEWNLTATGDLNRDGWLDVLVGAMDLQSIGRLQHQYSGPAETAKDPILFFENRMRAR